MAVARIDPDAVVIDDHLRSVPVELDLVNPILPSEGFSTKVGIKGLMNFKRMHRTHEPRVN